MDRTCFYFKKIGHDGIIYENKHEGIGVSYIVFNPNQIKSATDNVGTFSNNSNDIRFSISDNGGQNLSEAERQEINNLSGRGLVVDGDFGPATAQAVRDLQKFVGLPVTGVADSAVWSLLLS